MTVESIKIATRKSALAIWQAEEVARRLQDLAPTVQIELVSMTTSGDRFLNAPLATQGGKGLFVKELETSMLEGETDIAVHSMKDVPYQLPPGLVIGAILEREDPRDALVSNRFTSIENLPHAARVGTASTRRRLQLAERRPDLDIQPLRGNVNTRLAKLDHGEHDAILLACAGLKRLGLADRIRQSLDTSIHIPSIGQGAIGIECRVDDDELRLLLAPLHHSQTARCVEAERVISKQLQASCQLPIAAHAWYSANEFHMSAWIGHEQDYRQSISARSAGCDPDQVTHTILEDLRAKGAAQLIAALNSSLQ